MIIQKLIVYISGLKYFVKRLIFKVGGGVGLY